jgi:DNA-binding response OmpR family regulator
MKMHDRVVSPMAKECLLARIVLLSIRDQLPMSLTNSGLVRFDEYKIDRGQWQLTWRAQSIPLNRKTFDLLLFLIDHRERVISKKS